MEEGKVVVALGGGRRNFQTVENGGRRSLKDLVNRLRFSSITQVQHWQSKRVICRWKEDEDHNYMETSDDLASWDRNGRALGLFAMSHMDYEVELNIHCGSLMAIRF